MENKINKTIGESVNLNWAIDTYDKEGMDALIAEAEKEIKKKMNIAIMPHITRGEEVIKKLESLGGVNADEHKGNLPLEWKSAYYIYGDCTIQFARIDFLKKLNYKIYTLEEYEERGL